MWETVGSLNAGMGIRSARAAAFYTGDCFRRKTADRFCGNTMSNLMNGTCGIDEWLNHGKEIAFAAISSVG
jgi:hypothetical protein